MTTAENTYQNVKLIFEINLFTNWDVCFFFSFCENMNLSQQYRAWNMEYWNFTTNSIPFMQAITFRKFLVCVKIGNNLLGKKWSDEINFSHKSELLQ